MSRLIVFLTLLFFCAVPAIICAGDQYEDSDLGTPVSDPLSALYEDAMQLYKQHRYVEAREKFLQLQSISPEAYPSSQVFLKRIDQHLVRQEAHLKNEQERQDALRRKKEEQLRLSKDVQSQALRQTYRQEKTEKAKKKKIAALKQKQAARDLLRRGESRYKNILALYKAGRIVEARDQIQLLKNFLVKYDVPMGFRGRMTRKIYQAEVMIEKHEHKLREKAARLEERNQKRAQQQLTKERQRAEPGPIKEQKKARTEKPMMIPEQKEEKVLSKKDQFAALLARYDAAEQEAARKASPPAKTSPHPPKKNSVTRSEHQELKAKLSQEVDNLYHDGIAFYQSRQWSSARNIFSEVDKLWPNFKSTRSYLTVIDHNLKASAGPGKAAKSRDEIIAEALDSYQ